MSEYICNELAGWDIYNGGNPRIKLWRGDEEVIRCRDCAYHTQEFRYESVQCYCEYFDFYTEDDNGFCAWAERRKA